MNSYNTIFRKAGALLLLLVFLCIHIAKLSHVHDTGSKDRYASSTEQVKKSFDCSICDYHLAKDCHCTEGYFQPLAPAEPQLLYATHCPAPFTSIGLAYADRGPPALA